MDKLSCLWRESSFVVLDLETTGRYPIEAEICEIAAVRWEQGKITDSYQTLVKPSQPMSDFVISIHNITNEMVENAPKINQVIASFHDFIKDDVCIAHHAPFDMGFLSYEFEQANLPLPLYPMLCTSLLSRRNVQGTANHRLTTLAQHFNIDIPNRHRAMDDSVACLGVALKCFELIGEDANVEALLRAQGKALYWQDYSIKDLEESEIHGPMVKGLVVHRMLEFVYDGGGRPGRPRKVFPIGLVRNPDGDYLVAKEENQDQIKRYFLDRITDVKIID